ncbi:MAG TPA: Gfo/Idh/MocA family oxidoreductase [Candidatus Paceibacterota bacterium]|nr:Gfo/Idh/MocA family oxidoreductase [Verrucomicrobiota bacterium]HRZ47386.1 Gfo/Idh/MocA family oxidoreductase [Candidatus Paceibacterota bacterium]HRZ91938.1 Gfo/Idh/MocA family oxidoreductase [Candidatus Paceibacterota bacterium]
MSKLTRRSFLKYSMAAGATVWIGGTASTPRVFGANDRLRIAVAGVNGRGGSHIGGWLEQPNVEIAYLVDPDQRVLGNQLKNLEKKVAGKYACKGVADIRRALEDKDLDAISIATPNHWHSLMTIWAAQAGKHVYVEKPMSHDIAEGRVAWEAQKKYGVVVQHGTQSRSSASNAGLHQAIHEGKFGKLKISYGYACKPRAGIGFKPMSDPPADLDWSLWRGPAVIPQFHANLVHYNWHWFWVSGNGELNNQGTHQLDMAYWALDPSVTLPVRAMAIGGRFQWNDQGETPNTMFGIAQYPNGQYVFFNVRNVNYKGYQQQVENEYYFEDGGKIVRNMYYAKGSSQGEKVSVPPGKVTPGGNWGSFIAACRAGKPEMANGTASQAHYSCTLGHVINNSYRLGQKVPFNAKAGRFGDNREAYEHFMTLHALMRDGVGVPENDAQYIVGPWLTFDPKTERFTGEFAAQANRLVKDPNRPGFEVPAPDKV